MKRFSGWWVAAGVWAMVAVAGQAGTLTQWSTIDALLKGRYEGVVTLGEMKKSGDFGLGTLENLDGEVVMLDGEVYQIDSHGAVHKPGDGVRTPFAAVAFFKGEIELAVPAGLTLDELQKRIDAVLPSANYFYAVRVTGAFAQVKTRSVGAQQKPYPLLSEVVKTQALFTLTETKGTLAGLRCPVFAKSLNVPGYHFHYLTENHQGGGHVLGLVTGEDVRVSVAVLRDFAVKLPETAEFKEVDLSGDQSKVLHAVESERK